jgi:hypothetical protein
VTVMALELGVRTEMGSVKLMAFGLGRDSALSLEKELVTSLLVHSWGLELVTLRALCLVMGLA